MKHTVYHQGQNDNPIGLQLVFLINSHGTQIIHQLNLHYHDVNFCFSLDTLPCDINIFNNKKHTLYTPFFCDKNATLSRKIQNKNKGKTPCTLPEYAPLLKPPLPPL